VLDEGVVVGLCVEGSGGENIVVRNGGDINGPVVQSITNITADHLHNICM
jgi:hypothetical protein